MYARGICVVAAWLVLLAIVPYGEISGDIVPGDDSMWARKACADESGLQVIDKMEHIGEVYAIVALEGGLVYAVTSYASKDANDVIWYPVHIRVFDVSIPMDICQVSRQEIKRLARVYKL